MAKDNNKSGWKKPATQKKKPRFESEEKEYKPLKATGDWGTVEPKPKNKVRSSRNKSTQSKAMSSQSKTASKKPYSQKTIKPESKKNDAKGEQKRTGTDLKRINRNLNFKREETKTNARKDWTEARCIVCKQSVILPFKPRKPEIYCDVCVKKYKHKKPKTKPVEKEAVDPTVFVRKKATPLYKKKKSFTKF